MKKKDLLRDGAFILIGTLLVSAAVKYIYSPADLDTGGVSGAAVVLESLFSVPLWLSNTMLNLPLFLLAWRAKGWAFIRRTLAATALLSAELYLLPEHTLPLADDMFLAAVFGGLLCGVGMGLVFSARTTTGGTDLLAVLLQRKWRHLSLPQLTGAADLVIIAAGFAVFGLVKGLYALTAVFVTARVSDFILLGLRSSKAAYILSPDSEAIARDILREMDRGVTGIHAKGMYSGAESNMLYCVVSPREIPELKQLVQRTDPEAFVIISDVSEVSGEGFSREKT